MAGSPPRHIVIIGGGVVGVCTAYYLLRTRGRLVDAATASSSPVPTQIRVTLVEAHQVAGAASGKASGFLALDWHGPATTPLAKLSYKLHQDLAREYDGGRSWGYRSIDSLSYTVSAALSGSPETEKTLQDVRSNVIPPQEPDDLEEADVDYHWLNKAGQGSVLGTGETTAQILPREFVESIFVLARLLGLNYVRGTAVKFKRSSTVGEPNSLMVRATSSQAVLELPCAELVLAAGPWTGSLIPDLGLASVLPMRSSPGHSLVVRPNPPDPLPPVAVFANIYGASRASRSSTDSLSTSPTRTTESPEILPRADGTVYISGESDGAPLPPSSAEVDSLVDDGIAQRLIRAMGHISPALETGKVEARLLGYRSVTPDGKPVIGELEDHVWVAAGHGSWGITLAPGTGQVMAELILSGTSTSASISALDPKRFQST